MAYDIEDDLMDDNKALKAENQKLRAEVRRLRAKCGEPLDDMLPCPSCKGAPLFRGSKEKREVRCVYCSQCGMTGPGDESDAAAVCKWNELPRRTS